MDCNLFVLTTPLLLLTSTMIGYFVGIQNLEFRVERLQEYNIDLEKLLEQTEKKLSLSLKRLEAVSSSLESDEL
jgi:hypothetical protein